MENDLDLTLRLGLPVPTVETHLDLSLQLTTPTTHDQGLLVNGGQQVSNGGGRRRGIFGGEIDLNDEGASNNLNVNIKMYNSAFQLFAGMGNTLNFAPHPMLPYEPPREYPTRGDNYVLIDVPARRAYNNFLATANASAAAAANQTAAAAAAAAANARRARGKCPETDVDRKCTNRNCNAQDTPMWRRGPLGPKSLCNACGIKFRKEQERRARRNNAAV